MRYVRLPTDDADARVMGGKGAALAALTQAGFPVPGFFVLAPLAFEESLTDAQRSELRGAADATTLRRVVDSVVPIESVVAEVTAAVAALSHDGGSCAVRSSATDEDGAAHSFAGQFESYLCVPPERVAERIRDVWRSGFTDRVIAYRKEHGLPLLPVAPAVLVQRMAEADVAGVAFAADPVTGRRTVAVVSAVPGLGTTLVGGDADADTFRVDRTGAIVDRQIAAKRLIHRPDKGAADGVGTYEVDAAAAAAAVLTDAQAVAVADLARRASVHFGRLQDIEWAIESEKLWLLQSRPITSLAGIPDPDGVRNLWDNSNIAESYSGVTTPLTFSFARRAYEGVYRQFCNLMKVPRATIEANDDMFGRMLGLVRGRVYYNLLNWYRLLAMLPGFAANRAFMEQMMGVREGIPDEVAGEIAASTWSARVKDRANLARTVGGLVLNHFTLPRQIRRFYARLDDALRPPEPPLDRMRIDELTAAFQMLERKLLKSWDAPLVNDFFAMIFFGVLGKLAAGWCGKPALHNDLIADEGGIVSAEPARRIMEMGRLAAATPELINAMCDGPVPAALVAIQRNPELAAAYTAYLDKFADRCLEELKLESQTLADDPTPLVRSIGHAARRCVQSAGDDAQPRRQSPRQEAERAAASALSGHPLRRLIFAWVTKHARARVRDRENLRFERTRLFGRVRRIFVEVGRRLAAEGLLDDARDVFYLEDEEVLRFVGGTATGTDLRGLARLRRAEFECHRRNAVPAERFETMGGVYLGNTFEPASPAASASASVGTLQGIGCCPGVVRGPVRVVRDPATARLAPGEILVAERTDPGWIMLFPSAAGILVERGSLLSHSAIVAREMGIPAVVSIPKLTTRLETGQWVEMDGSAGSVRLIVKTDEPQPEGREAVEA